MRTQAEKGGTAGKGKQAGGFSLVAATLNNYNRASLPTKVQLER